MTTPETAPAAPVDQRTTGRLEHRIARVLTIGTWVGFGLLSLGVVAMVVAGISPLDPVYPTFDLGALAGDLADLVPASYLWLGLIVVLATPLLRVAAAFVGYATQGERTMALVSAAILVVIAVAVVVGSAGA